MSTSDSALQPPRLIFTSSESRHADSGRFWQGIPSLERTDNGTLYVIFYSGQKTEESGNFAVVMRSGDNGQNWISPWLIVEHDDPAVRVYDPNVWQDPLGRLWLFWAQSYDKYDGRAGVWAAVTEQPDAVSPRWSEPRRIANGIMMNKPAVLADGTWLLPCAVWASYPGGEDHPELQEERFSNVYASTDQGATFTRRGGADIAERSFDEHMVVELRDGRLWMLVRTRYGIGQSFSSDGGASWTSGTDSGLGGPCSRFFIARLRSGRLLLVNHVDFTGRNNLAALLSDDDGKTWPHRLLIDERDHVSYPDAVEAEDGRILVVYDRDRYGQREILLASLTEADILAGRATDPRSWLQQVINRATG